jgi:hypothetical protein
MKRTTRRRVRFAAATAGVVLAGMMAVPTLAGAQTPGDDEPVLNPEPDPTSPTPITEPAPGGGDDHHAPGEDHEAPDDGHPIPGEPGSPAPTKPPAPTKTQPGAPTKAPTTKAPTTTKAKTASKGVKTQPKFTG